MKNKKADKIKVVVFEESHGVFRAEIAGGWWVATSSNKEKAVEQVVSRYEKECVFFMVKPH